MQNHSAFLHRPGDSRVAPHVRDSLTIHVRRPEAPCQACSGGHARHTALRDAVVRFSGVSRMLRAVDDIFLDYH